MFVRPSDILFICDEYVIVDPDGDIVYSEDIMWCIQDEKDEALLREWL